VKIYGYRWKLLILKHGMPHKKDRCNDLKTTNDLYWGKRMGTGRVMEKINN